MKKCGKCNQSLPTSAFRQDAKKPDGLQSSCIICKRAHRAAYQAKWRRLNLDKAASYAKRWRDTHLEYARKARREHYSKNSESYIQRVSEWNKRNRDKRAAAERARKTTSSVLHAKISSGLRKALRSKKGGERSTSIVGYSIEVLVRHIERQFSRGMSWENIGEWHIDHITPISSFNLSGLDDPQIKIAWGLANLRPLWARENLVKNNKRAFLI